MRYGLGVLLIIGLSLLAIAIWPLPKDLETNQRYSFYDVNGELLYKEAAYQETQTDFPEFLKQAIVALEDKNFNQHRGVDFAAVFRAAKQNFTAGQTISGASTITMQLARLQFLENQSRNYGYKLKQIFWALKLEQYLSKAEILERYLNRVSLGHNEIGFPAGAKRYFSKTLSQLSVVEMATLLAIVQNPSRFNPLTNPETALERRNLVLRRLWEADLISEADYNYWRSLTLELNPSVDNFIVAPHFVFWVRNQLERLELPNTEIQVHTTLDKKLYEDTLLILREVITQETVSKKINNGAVVVLDSQNQIRVMVGSPDFFNTEISGAVNLAVSPRQTGSVLKPFLFALALEKGFSPAMALNDQKTIFPDGYFPRNFEVEEENGFVRFREALANSYNIAAVDLLNRVGVGTFHAFLKTLGLNQVQGVEELGLSMVLGSAQASLLSLTQSYSVFTHQGELDELGFITALKTPEGEILYNSGAPTSKKILSTDSAEWVQQVLSDDEARWKNFSRGNSLELDFPSGAKTGTSQAFKDNWVLGFSPQFTVGVWVGNADGTPMISSSGMQGAGPVWQKVMQLLHRANSLENFTYKGERTERILCRRPEQTICSEKVKVFLTLSEVNLLENPPVNKADTFSFVYPVAGDRFAEDSDLLLQVRGNTSEIAYYLHNGVKQTSPIFHNLKIGNHAFQAVSLDGSIAKVHIQVVKLR